MFTGIIEATGIITKIEKEEHNIHFTLKAPFTSELKVDQSVAHNGCCLTITQIENEQYKVTAIDETLKKTNLKYWEIDTIVNLERCVKMNGRLDGHIVQGHVDGIGKVVSIDEIKGSFLVTIAYDADFVTIPQGSITLNGISLTVAKSNEKSFSVAIIPYTWEHTNMNLLRVNDEVNLEFDVIGKYIAKLINKNEKN